MNNNQDIFENVMRKYEQLACDNATQIAYELCDEDRVKAFKSFIYYVYRSVDSSSAFTTAKKFFVYEATRQGHSGVEIERELCDETMFTEVVIRASLRSIAVCAKHLDIISECKVNWHTLQCKLLQAAQNGFEQYVQEQEVYVRIYA